MRPRLRRRQHEHSLREGSALTSEQNIDTSKALAGMVIGFFEADIGAGFALPQWTLDPEATQPATWRYPKS